MGYFANLYVAELTAKPDDVETRTLIYGREIGGRAYFSVGEGERPPGLHSYANGTVFSDVELRLLPGYPLIQREGDDSETCLFEANFTPRQGDDPVMFHFLLPERFIPRRDKKPLDQPTIPFVSRVGDRLSATYPVIGPGTFRFWVEQLRTARSLDEYDLQKLFHPDEVRSVKWGFEFNLGFFKAKVEEA